MSDLTDPQITTLRETWLLDEWIDSPQFVGLSRFNTAERKEFWTDTQIKAIDDYVINEYGEELDGLEGWKNSERLDASDTALEAATSATLSKLLARFRLIRAECWERMLNDPGFRKMLIQESEDVGRDLPDQWRRQIDSDRAFVMRRSGVAGMFRIRRY